MLDNTARLKALGEAERDSMTAKCNHCFHSIHGGMLPGPDGPVSIRWGCCQCGSVGSECLLDYYTMGRRLGREAARTALHTYDV